MEALEFLIHGRDELAAELLGREERGTLPAVQARRTAFRLARNDRTHPIME